MQRRHLAALSHHLPAQTCFSHSLSFWTMSRVSMGEVFLLCMAMLLSPFPKLTGTGQFPADLLLIAKGLSLQRQGTGHLRRSTYGGGATKALAGSLFLDNCQVANNTANAGAGVEIAGASGYYTVVGISNTLISGNTAALQGAAFNLGSTNATTFLNVTFVNNIGGPTRQLQFD